MKLKEKIYLENNVGYYEIFEFENIEEEKEYLKERKEKQKRRKNIIKKLDFS